MINLETGVLAVDVEQEKWINPGIEVLERDPQAWQDPPAWIEMHLYHGQLLALVSKWETAPYEMAN